MPSTLQALRREYGRTSQQFARFLSPRLAPFDRLDDHLRGPLFQPHRAARPVEYLMQRQLARHPMLGEMRDLRHAARAQFGDDAGLLALALWAAASVAGEHTGMATAAELWVLDQLDDTVTREDVCRVASDVLQELIGREPEVAPRLAPPAMSMLNLLASDLVGPPTDDLMTAAVSCLTAHVKSNAYERGTAAVLAIGALAWRAVDADLMKADAMRAAIDREPSLLKILESDLILDGARLSCVVPPDGRAARLVASICTERLAAMTDASGQHGHDGKIKSISLWPGADVLIAALGHLDKVRQLSRNEFQETPASSLWHVLRHTRPGPIDASTLLQVTSERSLLQAAVVAPWLAPHVAAALDAPAVDSFVRWLHAHTLSAMATNDRGQDCPRVQRQIDALVADRGVLTAAQRDSGIFEREWLLDAAASLGDTRCRTLLQFVPLAFRHQTQLADAIRALLGQADDGEVRSGASTQNALQVKLLGTLPGDDLADRLRLLSEAAASGPQANSTRRATTRRTAMIGAANLALRDGSGDAQLLAWKLGVDDWPAANPRTPRMVDRYECDLVLDEHGLPAIEVSRPDATKAGKPLKSVPRELAAMEPFLDLRHTVRDLAQPVEALTTTLETRLLTGDALRAGVLRRLLDHPLLAQMLGSCVFSANDDESVHGLPERAGEQLALRGHDGALHEVPDDDTAVRLAHPLVLRRDGVLAAWQDRAILHGLHQPFAQLFRAIDRDPSAAVVAGHQVRVVPTVERLLALGWSASAGQMPRRVFATSGHAVRWPLGNAAADLFARADVETGELEFTPGDRRGDNIPPRVLAEAVRDAHEAIAAGCSNGWPFPVIDARLDIVRRVATLHPAFRFAAGRVEPTFTRERLQLAVTLHVAAGKKKLKRARIANLWIDLRTGDVFLPGDDKPIDVPAGSRPVPRVWPHPPEESLRRVIRSLWSLLHGIDRARRPLIALLLPASQEA
ncbi:MAG: DUF4132 domain-containing protein [Planctomycetota bacterium]